MTVHQANADRAGSPSTCRFPVIAAFDYETGSTSWSTFVDVLGRVHSSIGVPMQCR